MSAPLLPFLIVALASQAPGGQSPGPNTPPAKPTVELLTPSPLDVTSINGSARLQFRLLITGTAPEIKSIEATPAAGDGRELEAKVSVELMESEQLQANQRVQTAVLKVEASKAVPQNIKYVGLLIIPGLGRVPYSITDKTAVSLTASPERLSAVRLLGEPESVRLAIRNSGNTGAIVEAASASMEDVGSKRRIDTALTIQEVPDPCTGGTSPKDTPTGCGIRIDAGGQTELVVELPHPLFAGTYSGSLSIKVRTGTLSVPLAVTTRGPSPGGQMWVPFTLFLLTLAVGMALSFKLEEFFGTGDGLRRAEAIVAMGALESALARERAALARLPLLWPGLLQQFVTLSDELSRARTVPGTPDLEGLLTRARTAQLAAMALQRLVPPAVVSLQQDPTALTEISAAVEGLAWPTDEATLKAFEQGVRTALDAAHKQSAQRAAAPPMAPRAGQPGIAVAAPGPLVLPQGALLTVSEAVDRIRRMVALQRSAIWLVTALTAYQTFYASNAAFGTALNYAAVFIWAVGITQAGTQIVTRARRPADG